MTLIGFHILQNHAPSNLNRDENGDPKDALFGGFRRGRISSQALKRSIRWHETFRQAIHDPSLLAERTRELPEWIRSTIIRMGATAAEEAAIVEKVHRFGKNDSRAAAKGDGDGSQKLKTEQLMFLSLREVETLGSWLLRTYRESPDMFEKASHKDMSEVIGSPHAVDIAMFGRMTTSSPFKDVEAAIQVAHALSTHTIEPEFDFFTAMDDRSEDLGAGMLGDVAFNSATYYKYINVHWEGLIQNLQGDEQIAQMALMAFLEAAITAIPKGKQNTFAAHNLPDFVLVDVLAPNIPLSYANAFLKPVQATRETSLMEGSIGALTNYATTIRAKYDLPMEQALFSTYTTTMDSVMSCDTIRSLYTWVESHLPRWEG